MIIKAPIKGEVPKWPSWQWGTDKQMAEYAEARVRAAILRYEMAILGKFVD